MWLAAKGAATDLGVLLIELGAILLVLGVLGRVAKWIKVPVIPLYLLAGLCLRRGRSADARRASEEFIATGAEIGVILLLLMLGLEYTASDLVTNLKSHYPAGLVDGALNAVPGAAAGPAGSAGDRWPRSCSPASPGSRRPGSSRRSSATAGPSGQPGDSRRSSACSSWRIWRWRSTCRSLTALVAGDGAAWPLQPSPWRSSLGVGGTRPVRGRALRCRRHLAFRLQRRS